MPRIARIIATGYPHHITQRGNNRATVFADHTNRSSIRLGAVYRPDGIQLEPKIADGNTGETAKNREVSLIIWGKTLRQPFLTIMHHYVYYHPVNRTKKLPLHLSAIVMLLVMLLSPVIGVCHDDEFCASPAGNTVSMPHDRQDAPCSPDSGRHDPSHDSCSDCPCHSPLPPTVIKVSVVTSEINNSHSDPSLYFPEVYLSLFDPPDVAA